MKTLDKLTVEQFRTISKIADRAMAMYKQFGGRGRQKIDWMMDIECAHKDIPLDLDRLLKADDFNFSHDVFGIAKHLNRTTLKIEDCFVPRTALPVSKAA